MQQARTFLLLFLVNGNDFLILYDSLLISSAQNWVGIIVNDNSLSEKIVNQLIGLEKEQHKINWEQKRNH